MQEVATYLKMDIKIWQSPLCSTYNIMKEQDNVRKINKKRRRVKMTKSTKKTAPKGVYRENTRLY